MTTKRTPVTLHAAVERDIELVVGAENDLIFIGFRRPILYIAFPPDDIDNLIESLQRYKAVVLEARKEKPLQ